MKKVHTKKGAASFFVVVFATLLLSVVVLGFSAAVVSEIIRTQNDDLAKSAYDAALAGVEDAKAAIAIYQDCMKRDDSFITSSGATCGEVRGFVDGNECDMVANILKRSIAKDENDNPKGVLIEESSTGGNDMEQYYTCTKFTGNLADYRSSVNEATSSRVVKLNLENADELNSLRLSWYADTNGTSYNYTNYENGKVVFPSVDGEKVATPPTISLQVLQTAGSFTLDDFTISNGDQTDRGTIFLVPTNNKETTTSEGANYQVAYNGEDNVIGAQALVKSNDKTATNLPYTVYCNGGGEFACSVSITLPQPIGGGRKSDTFLLIVSLPYGVPDTDFSIEVCRGDKCEVAASSTEESSEGTNKNNITLTNAQFSIDSTGRANDLYRRVEVRVENSNTYFSYPDFALQLLGSDGSSSSGGEETLLEKTFYTTCEYDFGPTCSR